jgi:Oxidoreductase molybdopterin binding domain
VTIASGGNTPVLLTAMQLAKLPEVTVSVSFGTDHGQFHGTFSGPLLWTVLVDSKAIDPKSPRRHVDEIALITGSDGYAAALALGEIAPVFENKSVILAEQMNGKPLGPDHFRLVVPGDRRGGRSVRDVVSILVEDAASKP